MGYLADGFAEFRISSGHRLASEYYVGEFIRALTEKDCIELLELDAKLAVASGVFEHKTDYESFRGGLIIDSYDFSLIGNLINEAIMEDIAGGSELMDVLLKRLDPSLRKPEYCATVIAKRLFHQVQTQEFVDEAEDLLAEARQATQGGAEDEEDERIAPIVIESLQRVLVEALPLDWESYDHLLGRSRIQQRHAFVAAEYTL